MDEIEIVVNLTPPQFHTEINRRILLALHRYCCTLIRAGIDSAVGKAGSGKGTYIQSAHAGDLRHRGYIGSA